MALRGVYAVEGDAERLLEILYRSCQMERAVRVRLLFHGEMELLRELAHRLQGTWVRTVLLIELFMRHPVRGIRDDRAVQRFAPAHDDGYCSLLSGRMIAV